MVRDHPWNIAAAVFAFGVSPVRIEASRTLAADPDLRLVSDCSEYMRTER